MGIFLCVGLLPLLAAGTFPQFLYFTLSTQTFLVLHNIAEIFSVVVSISIFGIGWFADEEQKNQRTLLISAVFLAIGVLDFMHALSHEGMPDFITENSVNKAAQFRIFARLLTALALLFVSAHFKKVNLFPGRKLLLLITLAATALVFTGIVFVPEMVPDAYRASGGLTIFKKCIEFFIILILTAAAFFYLLDHRHNRRSANAYLPAAFVFCILGELASALYDTAFDFFNLTGHIYKIISFILIYYSLFVTCINDPHRRIFNLNRRLAKIAERHKQAEQKITTLSREITRMTEIERADLAEILHESLNQRLVTATLALKANVADLDEIGIREREKILDPIRKALEISRKIASQLSPTHLKTIGLTLTIEDLLQDFNKAGKYRIDAKLDALQEYFPHDWSIDVYRIIQEALNNIEKHAQADKITICAELLPAGLVLTITDNGRTAKDPERAASAHGIGIPMIKQRATAMGGTVQTQQQDSGFSIVLTLPNNGNTQS